MKQQIKQLEIEIILKTLIYLKARKLNFTFFEIYNHLINFNGLNKISLNIEKVYYILERLKKKGYIDFISGSYSYILGKDNKRLPIKDKKIQLLKIKKVNFYLKILKYIPLVRYVGINGSIALGNPSEKSDVDLFIVSKNNRIWTTRFILAFIFEVLGVRRKRGKVENKICLNHFVTLNSLEIISKDLYTAFELIFMITIIDNNNTYKKIVKNNKWVNGFFIQSPWNKEFDRMNNFKINNYWRFENKKDFISFFLEKIMDFFIFDYLEVFFARLQKRKIEKRLKNNHNRSIIFNNKRLVFHPLPKSKYYSKKINKLLTLENKNIKKIIKIFYK